MRPRSVLLLAFLLLLSIAGCPRGQNHNFHPLSNELTPPESSRLVRLTKYLGEETPTYSLFDGQYPADWPTNFELPEGTYIKSPLELEADELPAWRDMGAHHISFNCLVSLPCKELISYFKSQAKSAGGSFTDQGETTSDVLSEGAEDLGVGRGFHDLLIENLPQPDTEKIKIRIWLDQDIDGYTWFGGAVTVWKDTEETGAKQ